MGTDLVVVDNPDYLHIEVTGVWSRETARQLLDDFAAMVLESGHVKVLADTREQVVESSVGLEYRLAEYFASLFEGKNYRIANLVKEGDPFAAFFETVAVNRGVDMRTFSGEQEAREWLLGERAGGADYS